MPNRQKYSYITAFACFALFALDLRAQTDSTATDALLGNIYSILKEDSLDMISPQHTAVAGFKEEDIRDIPGAVTIITADQIKSMGATDLMSVLYATPGIGLCHDVDDVIGIGMRGLWANESKVQFMLNGIPLNDLDFGTYALGGRLSLENVSRIEIMNGPGSVIYGGVAALGVINIITYTPLEQPGTKINLQSGYSNGFLTPNLITISNNQKVDHDTYISIEASLQSGRRSTWNETSHDSRLISYGDSTRMNSQSILLTYQKKNYKSQFFLNNYTYEVSNKPYGIMMLSSALDNQWQKQINSSSTFKLRALYQYQLPWFNLNTSDPDITSTNTITQKVSGFAQFEKKLNNDITWVSGIQSYLTSGRIFNRNLTYYYNDSNRMCSDDIALHSEASHKSELGILRLGARVERNTFSKILFSPRVAYNKSIGRTYIKLLFSNAFKIPTLQNINLGPQDQNVKHESVSSGEITIGTKLGARSLFEVTAFKTGITNPIVYALDSLKTDSYINRNFTGTEGIESKIMILTEKTNVTMGFCTYRVNKKTDIPEFEAGANNTSGYLGLAKNRGTFASTFVLSNSIKWSLSAVIQGKTFSYHYAESTNSQSALKAEGPTTMLNTGIEINPTGLKALRIRFGVLNVFNQHIKVYGPTMNSTPALPIYARQVTLNLQFRINA